LVSGDAAAVFCCASYGHAVIFFDVAQYIHDKGGLDRQRESGPRLNSNPSVPSAPRRAVATQQRAHVRDCQRDFDLLVPEPGLHIGVAAA
jgi:hypothetical protein